MVSDGIQTNFYPNRKSLWPTMSKRMNELCVKCPKILFDAVSAFFSHSLSLSLSFSVHLNSIYFVFIFRAACVLTDLLSFLLSICLDAIIRYDAVLFALHSDSKMIRQSMKCTQELDARAVWNHSGKWLIVFDFRPCSKCRKIL